MKRFFHMPLVLLLLCCLSYFESAALASPEAIQKDAQPGTDLQAPPDTEAEGMPQAENYYYDPRGKIDPFEPFIGKKEAVSRLKTGGKSEHLLKMINLLEELKKPRTELQRIDIPSLTVTAIVKMDGKVAAMVKGPDNGKGYMLKKGAYIGTNGGVVEKIICTEQETPLGKQVIRKILIKEPYLNQEGKLLYKNIEMCMPGSSFE